MLHCIRNVLVRKDKFDHSTCIHTQNFNKERNKFRLLHIVLSYSLNNVIY
jgi:hypothetical protein